MPIRPFLVLGTPRSRTAWLARFLTYGPFLCVHEPSVEFRGLGDLAAFLARPFTGASDSMMTLLWREILEARPDAAIVAVRRPTDQVWASIARTGFDNDQVRRVLSRIEAALEEVERLPQVLRVGFADLAGEEACARVFEHCLGVPFDAAWWRRWAPVRAEVDFLRRIRETMRNLDGVRALYGEHL